MAYEYDRFEREEGGGSFLMGLLAGTVLGAGLGMLFAPKPGSELRSQLTEQTGRLRSTATGAYSQASERVHQMVDRSREAYDRARTGAEELAREVTSRTQKSGSVGNMTGAGTGVGTPSGPGTENRG